MRKINTTPYVGNRNAVIFIIGLHDNNLKNASDQIIRIFGRARVPVDVALPPLPVNGDAADYTYLRDFVDAGIINICLDGNSVIWLDADTALSSPSYSALTSNLSKYRQQMQQFFGVAASACILPESYYYEINYSAIKESGFKVVTSTAGQVSDITSEPVSWAGLRDLNGLYRLPLVATLDYTLPEPKKGKPSTSLNTSLLSRADAVIKAAMEQSLSQAGKAVVEIEPSTFLDSAGDIDSLKLTQLAVLIKYVNLKSDITTQDDWYSYTSRWSATSVAAGNRTMPAYNGGPAIIFRLDDVSAGWHEDVVKEVLLLFEKNAVPIDLGVVSNVDGTDSYDMPWLKDYVNKGIAGISVHGYDWDFYQLDTAQASTSYEDIKFKLRKARDSYAQYFGVNPVSLTVPTDSWDKSGYKAVQDAGYKIFSTHITEDPYPSIDLVDADGRKDPNGMYRIPTSSDVCVWDETKLAWTDVIDISKPAGINEYCKYYQAYEDLIENEIATTTCSLLSYLGVAAITIHPDAFVGIDGKVDKTKLAQIQPVIDWMKKIGTITTFEQWYNYRTGNR